ncbi:MAG: hypothetical protein ABUL72_00765, partial [Armatimonadota bacterium]
MYSDADKVSEAIWILLVVVGLLGGAGLGFVLGRKFAEASQAGANMRLEELIKRSAELEAQASKHQSDLTASREESLGHAAEVDKLNALMGVLQVQLTEQKQAASGYLDETYRLENVLSQAKQEQVRLQGVIDGLNQTLQEREVNHEERLKLYQDAEERFSDKFKALSAEALKTSTT